MRVLLQPKPLANPARLVMRKDSLIRHFASLHAFRILGLSQRWDPLLHPHHSTRATHTKGYGVASLLGVGWARMLFLNAYRTNTKPIATGAVVVQVDALLVEVEVASAVLVLLVERRRPGEAVVAHLADMRTVVAACGREKDRVAVLSCEFRSVHAVDLRHLVLTLLY